MSEEKVPYGLGGLASDPPLDTEEHQHEFDMRVALTDQHGMAIRFCKTCGKSWEIHGTLYGWASHWKEIREPG